MLFEVFPGGEVVRRDKRNWRNSHNCRLAEGVTTDFLAYPRKFVIRQVLTSEFGSGRNCGIMSAC